MVLYCDFTRDKPTKSESSSLSQHMDNFGNNFIQMCDVVHALCNSDCILKLKDSID